VKGHGIIPIYQQQQQAYAWLLFCCPGGGMGARFTVHLCAPDYMIKADQLHWASEGARWLALLLFFQLV